MPGVIDADELGDARLELRRVRRVVARGTVDPSGEGLHALLPAGDYSVQVNARDANTAGRNMTLATLAFEMPRAKASFTIEIP